MGPMASWLATPGGQTTPLQPGTGKIKKRRFIKVPFLNNPIYIDKSMKRVKSNYLISTLLILLTCHCLVAAKSNTHNSFYKQLASKPSMVLFHQAKHLAENNHTDSAMVVYSMLQTRYTNKAKDIDKELYADVMHSMGMAFYQRAAYASAMEYYMECLKICEEADLDSMLALSLKDMGNVYSVFGDYEGSCRLYERALAMAKKQGNRSLENKLLSNLICAYHPKAKLSDIHLYYKQYVKNTEQTARHEYNLLYFKGRISVYEGDNETALRYLKKSANYAITHHLPVDCLGSSYISIAHIYLQKGNKDIALRYLHANEQMGKKYNHKNLLYTSLKELSDIYEDMDKEKALAYKADYLYMADSIFNHNEFNRVKNAEFMYEINKSANEISTLSHEKDILSKTLQTKNRIQIATVVCSMVFALLLIMVFWQNKKLKNSYRVLFERNQANQANENIYIQRIKDMERQLALVYEERKQPSAANTTTVNEEQRELLLGKIMNVMKDTGVFCDYSFNIDQLAMLTESNSKYVSQVINDVYKKNFRSFLNDYRIKEAIKRLTDEKNYGNLTIKAIAESVGYKSQANFINVFTKATGIKPSLYQKIYKEKATRK